MVVFKTIAGLDKRYQAGSDGEIYSTMRKTRKKLAKGTNNGYHSVSVLLACGKRTNRNVHFLVCTGFNGERPTEGHQASHIDGDSHNNLPNNLTWKTVKSNLADRLLHGTHDRGTNNSRAKLDNTQLDKIREHLSEGKLTHQQIGVLFGVSRVFITKINTGVRYK